MGFSVIISKDIDGSVSYAEMSELSPAGTIIRSIWPVLENELKSVTVDALEKQLSRTKLIQLNSVLLSNC